MTKMDDYNKYLDEQENKGKVHFKIFKSLKPSHIVLLAVLFFVATLIAKSNQSKWIYFVLGGLVILFFISMFKQGQTKEPLSRAMAQSIAQKDLEGEIKSGRVFIHGTKIIPTGYFRDQSWNDGNGPILFKYHIGFTAKIPNKPRIEIVYQMDPFTGRCKGWIETPLGFKGENIKDRDIIIPEKIIREEKDQTKISTSQKP